MLINCLPMVSFSYCLYFADVDHPVVDPVNDLPAPETVLNKQKLQDEWEQAAPDYEEPSVPTWNEFTQKTTCHGIRYIFGQSKSKFRK